MTGQIRGPQPWLPNTWRRHGGREGQPRVSTWSPTHSRRVTRCRILCFQTPSPETPTIGAHACARGPAHLLSLQLARLGSAPRHGHRSVSNPRTRPCRTLSGECRRQPRESPVTARLPELTLTKHRSAGSSCVRSSPLGWPVSLQAYAGHACPHSFLSSWRGWRPAAPPRGTPTRHPHHLPPQTPGRSSLGPSALSHSGIISVPSTSGSSPVFLLLETLNLASAVIHQGNIYFLSGEPGE